MMDPARPESARYEGLTRDQTIPYELEIRDCSAIALHHLDELERAAAEVVAWQDRNGRRGALTATSSSQQVEAQGALFGHLESLLAALGRLSLLLFPTSKSEFAVRRGATLRSCLHILPDSPLANRELRDAWLHHDERIDAAIQANRVPSGQVFTRSHADCSRLLDTFLRVVAVDTKEVFFWTRDGAKRSASLSHIRLALAGLVARLDTAFADLPLGLTTPNERFG